MVNPIPIRVRVVWDKWNIRGVLLFSLSLQAFLILGAPYRKSSRHKFLILLIWSGYLLADWAANFAVGIISNSQRDQDGPPSSRLRSDLLAFWAPFLLLHLGGPDTITAFALEDNELWLRHLLGLIFQAVAALYVFAQSLAENVLWLPTVPMFIAGVIKYAERTRALYLASLDRFRDSMLKQPDPGPNYAKLMEEYASNLEAKLPTKIIYIPEPDKASKQTDIVVKKGRLDELEVVQYAYRYFKIFKGLVVDLIFSFRERNESREFFQDRNSEDVLKVIEVELNFIYEVLYTKVEVVHSMLGYVFRGIAFGSVVAALELFHFKAKRHKFNQFDVGITYTLLLGAIALDVIALLMLVFSDWTYAALKKLDSESELKRESFLEKFKLFVAGIVGCFLRLKKSRWHTYERKVEVREENNISCKHTVVVTPVIFRRWSGSISAHNLIRYCLKSHPTRIHQFKSWSEVLIEEIIERLQIKKALDYVGSAIKKVIDTLVTLLGSIKGKFCKSIITSIKKMFSQMNNFIVSKVESFMENYKVAYWLIYLIMQPLRLIIQLLCLIVSTLFLLFSSVWKKIFDRLGVKDFLDEIRYVTREPFTKELWQFIYNELERKSKYADDPETAKRIYSARGDWVLTDTDFKGDRSKLISYATDVPYDQSLLLWHIATELCYNTEKVKDEENYHYRDFSKILSDYMLYLLVMQPTMMSSVAGIGKIRFRDTCAEAERFFARRKLKPDEQEEACRQIIAVNTDVEPLAVKGDRSKSVLFDASRLAKTLREFEEDKKEDKWKLMSKMWVELLSYAASHCRANRHAQQVSKGGELITFVWLLMAHFGLGEQFQINEGHARAKLIVGK